MDVLVIGIEFFLQVFDKKVLGGVFLALIPAMLWIFINKTFAKKKGLEDLKKDGESRLAKLNRRFFELEDFVKTDLCELKNSKVSKEEMHDYLEEFKQAVSDMEKKLQTVVASVGYLVQKDGGTLEDILQLNKKDG